MIRGSRPVFRGLAAAWTVIRFPKPSKKRPVYGGPAFRGCTLASSGGHHRRGQMLFSAGPVKLKPASSNSSIPWRTTVARCWSPAMWNAPHRRMSRSASSRRAWGHPLESMSTASLSPRTYSPGSGTGKEGSTAPLVASTGMVWTAAKLVCESTTFI
jgi:hypothetical protein